MGDLPDEKVVRVELTDRRPRGLAAWFLLRGLLPAIFLAFAAVVFAQEEPPPTEQAEVLWMPEGYELLSLEERSAIPPEQMKEIGARNTASLKEAIAAMTPAERAEVHESLTRYGTTSEIPPHVRQYITIVDMMLLASGIEEKILADRSAVEDRYRKLLHDQESATRGFPGDSESVTAEADAIETAYRKPGDRYALYLRTLKPLRARPWNEAIRVCFRKIVRSDSYPNTQKISLYEAALVFLQARQKETPEEGAWYSLEAFLRLSMRNEVKEAKRLFDIAIQKNSRDLESRTFPILLAEVEGDAAEVERLMPRAREAWPKPEDLDRVILDDIPMLPREMQAKAREAFGGKYKKAHPTDWSSRADILAASIERSRFREVESETSALLALPKSTMPEPDRAEFSALRLRAIAGLGRCDDVVVEIPRLEAAAQTAYRGQFDGDNPPAPRTVLDVQELRAELREGRRNLVKLRAAIADGSVENAPEFEEVQRPERRVQAEALASEYESELKQMEAALVGGSDAAIAADWSRRELAAWFHEVPMRENAFMDVADRGTRLGILVRSAAGKCLLAQHRAAEAARVLAPCVGSTRIFHTACGEPILDAGQELVKQGRWKDAAGVYAVTAPVLNFSLRAEELYGEIEKGAPGTVPHFEATPAPTPRVTVTIQVRP